MVLELILIGGVVYYYVKKNKRDKLRKEALLRGEPFYHKDGAVTFPPGYPDLPPYSRVEPPMSDYKRQIPVYGDENTARAQPYSDTVTNNTRWHGEKPPLSVETREMVNEKN